MSREETSHILIPKRAEVLHSRGPLTRRGKSLLAIGSQETAFRELPFAHFIAVQLHPGTAGALVDFSVQDWNNRGEIHQ